MIRCTKLPNIIIEFFEKFFIHLATLNLKNIKEDLLFSLFGERADKCLGFITQKDIYFVCFHYYVSITLQNYKLFPNNETKISKIFLILVLVKIMTK